MFGNTTNAGAPQLARTMNGNYQELRLGYKHNPAQRLPEPIDTRLDDSSNALNLSASSSGPGKPVQAGDSDHIAQIKMMMAHVRRKRNFGQDINGEFWDDTRENDLNEANGFKMCDQHNWVEQSLGKDGKFEKCWICSRKIKDSTLAISECHVYESYKAFEQDKTGSKGRAETLFLKIDRSGKRKRIYTGTNNSENKPTIPQGKKLSLKSVKQVMVNGDVEQNLYALYTKKGGNPNLFLYIPETKWTRTIERGTEIANDKIRKTFHCINNIKGLFRDLETQSINPRRRLVDRLQ